MRKNSAGEVLSKVRIENSPMALAEAVAAAGPEPEVVLEATFGWYCAADVLEEMGARVHLAHPLGNNWGNRRVKNDERDANDLVDLLRLGRLVEAWIARPEIREVREVVRYRLKLVRLRSGLKAQVHAVMGKHGVLPSRVDMFGLGGTAQLDALEFPAGYMARLDSLRDLIDVYNREINDLDRRIPKMLANHQGIQRARPCGRGHCRRAGRRVRARSPISRVSDSTGRRPVEVALVAGSIQLSVDGKVVRVHPARHDPAKEHGAFATPKGRPRKPATVA